MPPKEAENQYGDILNLAPRTFTHFSDAADENAQSRIYIGVHFDFDKEQGVIEGYHIADYDFNHELQPLHGSQNGIADNILNTVLVPHMADDFAHELATIGWNPGAPGGTAAGITVNGVGVQSSNGLGSGGLPLSDSSSFGAAALQPATAVGMNDQAPTSSRSTSAIVAALVSSNPSAQLQALASALGSPDLSSTSLDLTLAAGLT
jgi:hypothetical protein